MATKQQSVMEELEESSRTQSSHVPPVRVLSGNSDFSSPGPPSLSSAASPSHLPLPACPVRGILAQTTKQTPASDPQKSAVHSFQSLPHLLPSATKTEKYHKLVAFDCHVLKRPAAHTRNALKTTQQIEAVMRRLQKDLHKLESRQYENELDRELAYLAVYRTAFEAVIPLTGPSAPELTRLKGMYDSRVASALAKHSDMPGVGSSHQCSSEERQRKGELKQVMREVEEAEETLRALQGENRRLQKEYSKEKELHTAEMDRLQEPLPEPKFHEGEPFTAAVEALQMEIAEEQERLQRETERRKGMVPIQVHRQQEQQLRDIQAETRKLKALHDLLSHQVETAKSKLVEAIERANISRDTAQKLSAAIEEKCASLTSCTTSADSTPANGMMNEDVQEDSTPANIRHTS